MKEINIGNFRVFILNAGAPNLQRLGLTKSDYEVRCSKAKKVLEARSFKIRYNGANNPYDERHEMAEHQNYTVRQQTLPGYLEYFLEDEEDKKTLEVQAYLSVKR